GAQGGVRGLSGVRRHQPAVQMQDSRAFVRAPPGDGFPEPWAHAGRHHGDPRLARCCVRGSRPVINLNGPIRDESLTPDRVTTPEDMARHLFNDKGELVDHSEQRIALLGSGVAGWPLAARAQQPAIGYLSSGSPRGFTTPAAPRSFACGNGMDRLDAMKVFVVAVDEESLAAAGRKLGRS